MATCHFITNLQFAFLGTNGGGYFNANSTESENIFAVLTNFLNNPLPDGQTDGAISQMGGLTVKIVDRIALILVIIGALNWGSIGLFRFDCVAAIFGGQLAVWSRIIYTLVGIAGLWCITLLFREDDVE